MGVNVKETSGLGSIVKLGVHAKFTKGKGLPKSSLAVTGSRAIHYGELFTLYGAEIKEVFSNTNLLPTESVQSLANDVLMPTSDVTPNGLATASCIKESGVILGGDILIIRPDPKFINGTYLAYVIRNSKVQILNLVTGSTVYHLYGKDMANFEFYLPSVVEQKVIAEALSDFDALISSLKELLHKKTMIFEGTRFNLLSGNERLSGFKNQWKSSRGDDLVKVDWGNTNLTKSSYKENGKFLAVSATGIDGNIDHFEHDAKVPVISAIGALCGKMMLPKSKFVAIKNTLTLTPLKNRSDGVFIFHLFNHIQLPIRGGAQPFISKGDIEKFEIYVPFGADDSYDEQKEIGSILEEMAVDLENLEMLIRKYESLKQAMMNDLLTGKVRLI